MEVERTDEQLNTNAPPVSSSAVDLAVDGDTGDDQRQQTAQMLVEMLRGDELNDRVAAVQKLADVASVLGGERTRTELLPFLAESVDDEDEVLIALAERLGVLVPFIGGNTHAHLLLPLLEVLLTAEENTVREKAITSTFIVTDSLTDEAFNNVYAQMVVRLATKEWFTARISSCHLIANNFQRLNEDRRETYTKIFASLCRDDAPMVRRVAAQNLGLLVKGIVEAYGRNSIMENGLIFSLILPIFGDLSSNDQDSVRLHMSSNCISFVSLFIPFLKDATEKEQEIINNALNVTILPLLISVVDDSSWRVRWTAASQFAEGISAFSDFDGAIDLLIPTYEKLLQDTESEVRTAAAFNLADVAQCSIPVVVNEESNEKGSIAERLVKYVVALSDDDNEHVRAALASVATGLAPFLGKEKTISLLLPHLFSLLRDSASEVRLNLISTLSSLNEVIGITLLSQSLLPAILELAEDSKWRIRLVILQQIPLLAKQLGKSFVGDNLSPICVSMLEDNISSVREAAANNLSELTSLFGSDWAAAHLLPSIGKILKDPSYLRRLTAVKACASVATVMDSEVATHKVLPVILDMAKDDVPNIRFNVAKALLVISPKCNSMVETQILPTLRTLIEDCDRDVRYFAKQTLDSLGEQNFVKIA